MQNNNSGTEANIKKIRQYLIKIWVVNIPVLALYFFKIIPTSDSPISSTISSFMSFMPYLWVFLLAFTAYIELVVIRNLKNQLTDE